MTRLEAILYLVNNSRYKDEWSGAGMWKAVEAVINKSDNELSEEFLKQLLTSAENF